MFVFFLYNSISDTTADVTYDFLGDFKFIGQSFEFRWPYILSSESYNHNFPIIKQNLKDAWNAFGIMHATLTIKI